MSGAIIPAAPLTLMPFAIELFFDPAADRAVRSIWRALADAGISRTMVDLGSHPHVSLADTEDLDAERFRPVLEAFAREVPPLKCSLASMGLFLTHEGVVFLAPVVTRNLLDLHEAFHRRFGEYGARCSAYYMPGNWVPHCTLAMGVTPTAMGEAMRLCADATLLGRFDRIALVEFRPVRVVYAFDLAGG